MLYKKNDTEKLSNDQFLDINKVILKKIPYVYEILPKISDIHNMKGHIPYKTLSKYYLESEYYLPGIDIITEEFSFQCPEYFAKFFGKKILKNPKIIFDEGPHYRLLIGITYLDNKFFNGKTKYKYIIDSIEDFSNFYWGFLKLQKLYYKKLNVLLQLTKNKL